MHPNLGAVNILFFFVLFQIIMIDHGKQRTQKYIADNFAHNSRHTKQFFEEQKKMKKILKTSGIIYNASTISGYFWNTCGIAIKYVLLA